MILLFPFLLLFFFVIGLWLAHKGGRWAYKKYHHFFAYIGGFLLVSVLVFGDEVFGHYYWRHLCETKGGLHVYKKVPVEGFLDNYGDLGSAKYDLDRGYQYVEGKYPYYDRDRKLLYRLTIDANGKLIYTQINEPQSRYMYNIETVKYPHFIWGSDITIRDVQTNELIGVERNLGYKGGVIRRALLNFVGAQEGSASYCGDDRGNVIKETIPPIQTKNLK